MSKALIDALQALTDVAAAQLREARIAKQDRRELRQADPLFAAEIAAARRPLRRLSAANVWNVPHLADPFTKKIPDSFWLAVAVGVAQVSCPCGEAPELQAGVPLICTCDRAFLFTGQSVRVAVFEDDAEPVVD